MIKMSQEIYNKIKSPDIATVIEVCSLELLEFFVRMDGIIPMGGKLGGRGGGFVCVEERTYLKAMDDVKLNLRNMGVKKCRTRAWDRETEQNGHLSCQKLRPNLKGCTAKEEEEDTKMKQEKCLSLEVGQWRKLYSQVFICMLSFNFL